MAKDNKEKIRETDFEKAEIKQLAEESESDPLRAIALALVPVARGASVVELRKAVIAGAPPFGDREARNAYANTLKTMRNGADAALLLAQELASGV